jgi:hypothetical protein
MDNTVTVETFWDTSALVALLVIGPHTAEAGAAWNQSGRAWMWRWTRLEVEAALGKQRAPAEAWTSWRKIQAAMQTVDLEADQFPALCQFNRTAVLSPSVASQLFVFDRTQAAVTTLKLVTFDKETRLAADMLGMPLL